MSMRLRKMTVALVLGLAVASCGGSDTDDPELNSTTPTTPVEISSSPEASAEAAGGACAEAFSAADPDGDKITTFRTLLPAYTACASHDEWVTTAADFPFSVTTEDGQGGLSLAEVPATRCPFAKEVGNPEATSPVCTSLPG